MLKLPIKCKVILPYEQLGLEPKKIILKEMLIDLIKIWITQFGSKGAQFDYFDAHNSRICACMLQDNE